MLPKRGMISLIPNLPVSRECVCVRPVSTASSASIAVNPFDDNEAASEIPVLASPHPKASLLDGEAGQLQSLCPFVKTIRPIDRTPLDRPMGFGWEFEVVIPAPPASAYVGVDYPLQVRFDHEWPDSPPFIRFKSVLMHSQLTDAGVPIPDFYADLPGNSLAHVVLRAYEMLQEPLPQAYSADAALRLIASHDPACHCARVPVTLDEFIELPTHRQQAILGTVQKTLQISHEHNFTALAEKQRTVIQSMESYRKLCLHPEIFDATAGWRDDWFAPSYLAAIRTGTIDAFRGILHEEVPGVYSFDMFTPAFCAMLSDEAHNYEKSPLPKLRPNSMNNYGLILNYVGMEGMFDTLLRDYIKPMTRVLYPEDYGRSIDHHHTFLVQYKSGADLSLDMHIDDSEITVNVNILDTFEGAGLTVCGRADGKLHRKHAMTYGHKLGRAIIHVGIQRHGADAITEGERMNLIIWCRSSAHRLSDDTDQRRRIDMTIAPDVKCLSRTHDPDYKDWAGPELKK